jgi:hypothetical protein
VKNSSERFPWHRCMPGESFFVPTLNPLPVIQEGLRVGHEYYSINRGLRALFVIHDGLLGVLFTLPRRGPFSERS